MAPAKGSATATWSGPIRTQKAPHPGTSPIKGFCPAIGKPVGAPSRSDQLFDRPGGGFAARSTHVPRDETVYRESTVGPPSRRVAPEGALRSTWGGRSRKGLLSGEDRPDTAGIVAAGASGRRTAGGRSAGRRSAGIRAALFRLCRQQDVAHGDQERGYREQITRVNQPNWHCISHYFLAHYLNFLLFFPNLTSFLLQNDGRLCGPIGVIDVAFLGQGPCSLPRRGSKAGNNRLKVVHFSIIFDFR